MLAVPPAVLEILNLRPGARVGITVHHGQLIVEPQSRPSYTLDELLAQCDAKVPASKKKEEREWASGKPVGGEII